MPGIVDKDIEAFVAKVGLRLINGASDGAVRCDVELDVDNAAGGCGDDFLESRWRLGPSRRRENRGGL